MIGAEPRDADGAVRDPYEEERTRLSRELHDDIAQRIALASAGMGMRERARLVHAQLLISSTSGSGTVIEAHVPVRPRFDCPSW